MNRNNPYDNARLGLINQTQLVFPDFYCSQGCSTSWLSDKYCDNSCRTYTCGYDMGDCGPNSLYNEAYGLNLIQNEYQFVKIPRKTLVFYFNLTLNNLSSSMIDGIVAFNLTLSLSDTAVPAYSFIYLFSIDNKEVAN